MAHMFLKSALVEFDKYTTQLNDYVTAVQAGYASMEKDRFGNYPFIIQMRSWDKAYKNIHNACMS